MLARPRNEFAQFPAALSFLMLLAPADAATILAERAATLRGQLAAADATLLGSRGLPRVVTMDDEYLRAMLAAEVGWLDGVVADLRAGALTWSEDELEPMARASVPGGELALRLPGESAGRSRG
jgi:hypothetical protein